MYRFVFNGGIEKMYRQILILESDRSFQRILFRNDPKAIVGDYQLNTVTFGVNCAPYLAIRSLQQLSDDIKISASLAAYVLKNETYVDDVLLGGHTLSEALDCQSQLISSLNSAGFPLKKLTANHPDFLNNFESTDLLDEEFLKFRSTSDAKILGIRQNALRVAFSYKLASDAFPCESVTKRQVLSHIARLFDPAGQLTPITIKAKIIMQQLWLEGIGWDDKISDLAHEKWITFVEDLRLIEHIEIPRWVN